MNSIITHEQIKKYHKEMAGRNNSGPLYSILYDLEKNIIGDRDDLEKKLPVYLTKWRVKSINSIYLKTKRKSDNISSLEDITDYAGLRILCLFEQDLIIINKYLVEEFLPKFITDIKTIKLFNWKDGKLKDNLVKTLSLLKTRFQEAEIIPINTLDTERGYKSIHYVVYVNHRNKIYPVEIQARTLLQDVWGELEHALVYKQGTVNPHIRKSFYLLSRDLESSDMLVTHLRNIRDKEKGMEDFAKKRTGPYKHLGYEENLIPSIFKPQGKFHTDFESFNNHAMSERIPENLKEWIEKFTLLYENISDKLSGQDTKDEKVQYWSDAERAFLHFVKGEFDEAKKKYNDIVSSKICGNKYYAPYFRLGEIKFIEGNIESALVDFDISEEILSRYQSPNPVNAYRIKVKLAHSYWRLGSEYLKLALEEINDAKEIYYETKKISGTSSLFNDFDEILLVNNLCWYYLESHTNTGEESDYLVANDYFRQLESLLSNSNNHNAFDTAMWFCYQSYLKHEDEVWLEKAVRYCLEAEGKRIYATSRILSESIYRNHVQEIMSVWELTNNR